MANTMQYKATSAHNLPTKDSQCCAKLFLSLLRILVIQRRNGKTTVLLRLCNLTGSELGGRRRFYQWGCRWGWDLHVWSGGR